MNIQEALNVLNLSGEVTENEIKKAKKNLALKFHPDRNKNGSELMKAVNAAADFLLLHVDKLKGFKSTDSESFYDYGEEMSEVLSVLSELHGITFEVIGNWIWISGETKEHKEQLKEIKCKWAPKKKQWFYRPEEHKSTFNRKEHSIDEIREMYGTTGKRKGSFSKQITA